MHAFSHLIRATMQVVIACCLASAASAADLRTNIVLVHGMRSTPTSLIQLRRNLTRFGYRVLQVDYKITQTCAGLAESVRSSIDSTIARHKLIRSRTYVYGYSLGGMAVAQSNVEAIGIILDAPSNYPDEACVDLLNYLPLSPNYPKKVLEWRHQSNNSSQATEAFLKTSSRALIIGHSEDFMSPQKTILAYAHAPRASVWWVSGDHSTTWSQISRIIHNFIMVQDEAKR
jgi:hypothetical protein